MWNILCATLLIVSRLSEVKAYNVTCSFNLGFPACGTFTITPVTAAFEAINIVDQPSTYIDNVTQNVDLNIGSMLYYIPTTLFNHLTNIVQFVASRTSITTITTNAFANCKSLRNIHLAYNSFAHLPASFAEQCTFVRHVYMAFNNIHTVDENAFKGMISLEEVYLSDNKITCIPPLLFQDNKGLRFLDFGVNQITAIHSLFFQNLVQIGSVSFVSNLISYIPDLVLPNNGNTGKSYYIALRGNPIMAIYPLLLTNLFLHNAGSNIQQLQINFKPQNQNLTTCIGQDWMNQNFETDIFNIHGSEWYQQNITYTNTTTCYSNWTPQMADDSMVTCGSKITRTQTTTTTSTTATSGGGSGSNGNGTDMTTYAPGSCTSYRACRYYLDYLNRYTCVIDGADGYVSAIGGIHSSPFTDANVERVYFVNSQLSRIPNIIFQKFPNLNFLYVRSCGMGIINDHTFNECGNLKFLDASNNDIIHVDETSLKNCTKLEIIDLTGNPLDYVSTQLYDYDPSLKTVHLKRMSDFTLA